MRMVPFEYIFEEVCLVMIDNNGLLHFLCSSKIAPHKQQNYYTWKITQYKLYCYWKALF